VPEKPSGVLRLLVCLRLIKEVEDRSVIVMFLYGFLKNRRRREEM